MVQQEASQEKLCLSCLLSFLTEALWSNDVGLLQHLPYLRVLLRFVNCPNLVSLATIIANQQPQSDLEKFVSLVAMPWNLYPRH